MYAHRVASFVFMSALVANAAQADGVMHYRPEQSIDPQEVAAILRSPTETGDAQVRGIQFKPDSPRSGEGTEAHGGLPSAAKPASFTLFVKFGNDSTLIPADAQAQLDAIAMGIKLAGANVHVRIEGHTDASGSDRHNLILSRKRAEAVKKYLVSRHGIDMTSLRAVGLGKNMPLNWDNPFAPENRRVEFSAERS